MKIRTGFVTNSSSSSFIVSVIIEGKNGNEFGFSPEGCDLEYREPIVIEGLFDVQEGKLKSRYTNVEELAKFIMDSFSQKNFKLGDGGLFGWDEDLEEEFYKKGQASPLFIKMIKEIKEDFVEEFKTEFPNTKDISKITALREYSAWGEFADLIADNDRLLCTLARAVINSTGEEQKRSLIKMREYINTSRGRERQGEEFGRDFSDIRYKWNGNDEALIALAERLFNKDVADECSGREVQEIDLVNGKFMRYAEFDLR